ncbi:A/G-specific adenine glycosylase [Chitinophaga sp. Cy-1792]|uniref:A/G-specific adenine glycosylase n=1 Tax=Chitinophaga sp. Cy-1792 TaxID=2608339 RepID=UPI001422FF9A|nr:A/G-specific adenine glycosylase [Chitinophaga sp. Cy-1792]NIG52216.1 A/G-specific adenine glycosylase [Chitinophaga sp. Cy-1792]
MSAALIFFTEKLLEWNQESNTRTMPWKQEKDPYKIWLSEIILQQTRVEQGWPYYERFIQNYPTVSDLAAANEEEVFRLWQGLGYYARCKNMLAAAREITQTYHGRFPDKYEQINALKGIGPYTAAAIASFAFNLPYAVLDGNVFRVLSRFFGIETPIDSTAGKKEFAELAQKLLPKNASAVYNQSIMDFGATVCKPQLPECTSCPLQKKCNAYHQNLVSLLPIKSKKLQVKKRFFNYIIASFEDKVYIRKRINNDIWQNLHEFILIETPAAEDSTQILNSTDFQSIFGKQPFEVARVSKQFKQQLTHQTIHSQFINIEMEQPVEIPGYLLTERSTLDNFAFPKTITTFLQSKTGLLL